MEVLLNGEKYTVSAPCSITDLISLLQLQGKYAIEINQAIIPKSEYTTVAIRENDTIEIVQAIGGG